MCYLVTVAVLGYEGDVAGVFRRHGLLATAAMNPSVRAAMPGGALALDITRGGCSCSIYMLPRRNRVLDEDTERRRYAKKGWSRAKIDRAITAKKHVRERRSDETGAFASAFTSAMEEIASSGARIALVVHSYTGRFDEER